MNLEAQLQQLDALRTRWRPPPPEVAHRRRLRAAWANAAIEGNALPWPRARRLAEDSPARERAEREVLGCLRAALFLETAPAIWNLSLLRHLHSLVMDGLGGRPGELRRREVKIVKESGPGAGRPVFHPPHPARVRELLESLLAGTAAAAGDPFLLAGRFHYEFQSIHPFEDGNGRVGRLLSTLLARRGWPAEGFWLEPAIRRAGPAYYLALRAVRRDYEEEGPRGLDPWLGPFLDMAAQALRRPDADEEDP